MRRAPEWARRDYSDYQLAKMRTAILPNVLGIALYLLMLMAPWGCPKSLSAEDMASRIQAKIAEIGARATQIRESGADVSSIQQSMQQVDTLLKHGKPKDAEKILDMLLKKFEAPAAAGPARAEPANGHGCDPRQPMTVSGRVTIGEDCTIGGDLTVTGNAVLHFDYNRPQGGRLVVHGNVIVQDDATLWIEGRLGNQAVFVIDNDFNQQRSMTSTDNATIRLDYVEFRTRTSEDRGKGSISMSYEARNRSSFAATGATLNQEESWLLANLHDSAKLVIADTRHVPTEIYVNDSSSAKISGISTQTGVWLDADGARGIVKLPDMNGPFSWQIGSGAGLDVGWLLQINNAQPGIGIEVKPTSALTIIGNGTRAPATGELKISYFVAGLREMLDGLAAGLQNRKIGNRLTLKNVQLGPIAWQIYAGDNADLTIKNSTINEIGIFGQDATVRVEHSVLQLAVLAALAPGSALDVRDSDIWNQAVEVANTGRVSIVNSQIHGTLFFARNKGSAISIKDGAFHENPAPCTPAIMVNIATGRPRCNPFRPPGPPRSAGAGKVECTGTKGCKWGRATGAGDP